MTCQVNNCYCHEILNPGFHCSHCDPDREVDASTPRLIRWIRRHKTDLAIVGTGYLGLAWVFWCTWHGINPVGWFD